MNCQHAKTTAFKDRCQLHHSAGSRPKRSLYLLSSVALVGVLSASGHSFAADFTVLTPTIVTNGSAGNILNGNDSLTITSTGEIIVTGAHAVDASGIENVITNDGVIEVDSNSFFGINLQDDDNTVTNSSSGTITTSGNNSDAIDAQSDNTFTNHGMITTTGNTSNGIDARAGNTITNTGTISTAGTGSEGIRVREDNIIINSGTIIVTGDITDAIEGNEENRVTNNGMIIAEGASDSNGIFLTDDAIITNNGSISIANGTAMRGTSRATITNNGSVLIEEGEGINAGSDADITNRGTIEVTGGDASFHGIDIIAGVVSNSGSVVTLGVDTDAIEADRNATITNSGKAVSVGGSSIHFNDAFNLTGENTLNLLAPSFIGGTIDLGDFTTDTVVNITTGASHSILWDFSTGVMAGGDPNIGGTVPWFYNSTTKQIATFDPSVLAASVETLTDRTAMISATIQRRLEADELMINGVQRGKPDNYGSEMGAGHFDKSGVWVQVMASHSEYAGGAATLDRDITLGGFAVGYDANRDKDTRFGVMAGYIDGSSKAASRWSNSFKGNSSGFFAAGYGRRSYGNLFVDLGLSAGIGTDNETKRFVNDNLAALGESYAIGDAGASFWISPEVAIGTQIKGPTDWMFAPSAKLRYAAEWFGSYTETGPSADANAIVDNRMIAIGEARLELAASRRLQFGPAMHALFTARGGVLARASLGNDATITLVGVTQDVADFYEDSLALFAGADTSIAMGETVNLDLSTSATFNDELTNIQGAAAVSVAF